MSAPERIPDDMYQMYTMYGAIPVEYKYDDQFTGVSQDKLRENFTKLNFIESAERVSRREVNYYGNTDRWLYAALEEYPIKGMDVLLVGSTFPWYEAVCVAHGCRKCTVVEYGGRPDVHPQVEYVPPSELQGRTFQACISISSFEHDGLGRYGDPLDPEGDFGAMLRTKNLVMPDGLMYLAVPVGGGQDNLQPAPHLRPAQARPPPGVLGAR